MDLNEEDSTITFNTLEIPDNTNYWLCRANGGEFYDDFLKNNFIAIENDEIDLELLNLLEESKLKQKNLLQAYKNIYLESDYYKNILKELNKKNPDNIRNNETSYKRKAGIAATRSFNFIHEMKIGDIVIVPGIRSKNYLIGIISSTPFSFELDRLSYKVGSLCDFKFKREVKWIRQISKTDFPSSLAWGINAQKTIYNVTEHAIDINKLISSSYIYKDVFHHSLNVGTPDPITSFQWFQFQKTIFEVTKEKSKEVYIKTNVQSPGIIEFITNPHNLPLILLGIGVVLGDISYENKGIKINLSLKGLITYFSKAESLKRLTAEQEEQLKQKKIMLETQSLESAQELKHQMSEEELKAAQHENKKRELEIKEIEQRLKVDYDTKIESENLNKKVNNVIQTEKFSNFPQLDEEQKQSIEHLKIYDKSVKIENKYEMKRD